LLITVINYFPRLSREGDSGGGRGAGSERRAKKGEKVEERET